MLDVGVAGKQVAADFAQGLGDLAVEVSLAVAFAFEGVEDAIGRIVQLKREPGHRAFFGNRELAATLQEFTEFVDFKYGEFSSHVFAAQDPGVFVSNRRVPPPEVRPVTKKIKVTVTASVSGVSKTLAGRTEKAC